ncbi:MAG: hypothetical protein RBR70_00120 [Arcobacter sp.]|jgi:Ca2+-binding RTX toxin-like protein|uniref:calcium-binding protein n=1 Tax=Arcobacter sp. TaxID=1872629 RepID=UPI002A4D56D9|nr:hypothetical protein [Arcobacter sp.]MDX9815034.1 hypothetical protein [Sulfurimonadaceae bacterium]MDY3203459.1 hypothetical protein [Arcobacter sp.]
MNPTNISYSSTPTNSTITLTFPSAPSTVTEPTILKTDGTTINISDIKVISKQVIITIQQVLSFDDSISIISDENFFPSFKAQYFIGGKGPNKIDADIILNKEYKDNILIFANEGDDYIYSSKYYPSTITPGEGSDIITVSHPNTTMYLTESTNKQDIVIVPSTISQINNITKIYDFDLSSTAKTKSTNDTLSLPSTQIAKNTKLQDGIDIGSIEKHTITNGVVSFPQNIITTQELYQDAIDYLYLNLNLNETVVFDVAISNYHIGTTLYQKGSSPYDSKIIQLEQLSNITLGKTTGYNTLVITDKISPIITNMTYTKKNFSFQFNEDISNLKYLKNSIEIKKNNTIDIKNFKVSTSKNNLIFSEKKSNYKLSDYFQITFNPDTTITDKQKNVSDFSFNDETPYTFIIGSQDAFTANYASNTNPLQIYANKNNDTITGSAFDDIIYGDAGNDTLTGGAGNDTLNGGAGNDTLDGGTGQNILIGGAGNDTYIINDSNDVVIEYESNTGIDTVIIKASSYVLADNIENVIIDTKDVILTGNNSNNIFYSSTNNDTIDGSAGINTISYENAKAAVNVNLSLNIAQDTLMGTDTLSNIQNLIGSDFDDTLQGSQGTANTLSGLDGIDTFFINDDLDTITDFDALIDKIVLDQTQFTDILLVNFSNQKLSYDGVDILTLTGVNTLVVADVVSLA